MTSFSVNDYPAVRQAAQNLAEAQKRADAIEAQMRENGAECDRLRDHAKEEAVREAMKEAPEGAGKKAREALDAAAVTHTALVEDFTTAREVLERLRVAHRQAQEQARRDLASQAQDLLRTKAGALAEAFQTFQRINAEVQDIEAQVMHNAIRLPDERPVSVGGFVLTRGRPDARSLSAMTPEPAEAIAERFTAFVGG